jgi:hypothetical protein
MIFLVRTVRKSGVEDPSSTVVVAGPEVCADARISLTCRQIERTFRAGRPTVSGVAMLDAPRARFSRKSPMTQQDRQAKKAARAVARQKAQEHYRQVSARGKAEGSHGQEAFI